MKKILFLLILIILSALVYLFFQNNQRIIEKRVNPYKEVYQHHLAEAIIEYTVYRLPLHQTTTSIYTAKEPKAFSEWRAITPDTIIFNGGYFLEDYQPAGAIFSKGATISSRQFDLDKSGIIFIEDGKLSLINTEEDESLDKYQKQTTSYMQSYPFLIENGLSAIQQDSEVLARRTVLATTKDDLLIIIVDRTPVSLFELTEILLEQNPDIEMALNLDGGPSTALSFQNEEYQEAYYPISGLPQILGVQLHP